MNLTKIVKIKILNLLLLNKLKQFKVKKSLNNNKIHLNYIKIAIGKIKK